MQTNVKEDDKGLFQLTVPALACYQPYSSHFSWFDRLSSSVSCTAKKTRSVICYCYCKFKHGPVTKSSTEPAESKYWCFQLVLLRYPVEILDRIPTTLSHSCRIFPHPLQISGVELKARCGLNSKSSLTSSTARYRATFPRLSSFEKFFLQA